MFGNMEDKTKVFIEKAQLLHGNKYDYSKVEYVNAKTKVCIICLEHGEFWQTPTNHLSGKGCKLCSLNVVKCKKTKGIKQFIEEANVVHDFKYDYSKFIYTSTLDESIVICPIHGEFKVQAYRHVHNKQGCPYCVEESKKELVTNEFINKASDIHNNKYDYSKVDYKNIATKVCIICPIHGEFYLTPKSHLNNVGCPKCKEYERINDFISKSLNIHENKYTYEKIKTLKSLDEKVIITCPIHGDFKQSAICHLRGQGCPLCANDNKRYDTSSFIEKSKLIHGDKYDYSKVNYINNSTKVTIICPIHGEFEQLPNAHLSNKGCPKCSGKYKTTSEFIIEAKQIHGDNYDYSKVEYIGSKTKVCIICPKHGEFWQTPNKHLLMHGCPSCSMSHIETLIYNFLKKNDIKFETEKKFEWLGNQRLDFYLTDYNIAIECQGEQHFKSNCKKTWFNSSNIDIESFFNETLNRDINKYRLCKSNNLTILYFFNKKYNIETKDSIYCNIYNNNTYNNISDLHNTLKQILE